MLKIVNKCLSEPKWHASSGCVKYSCFDPIGWWPGGGGQGVGGSWKLDRKIWFPYVPSGILRRIGKCLEVSISCIQQWRRCIFQMLYSIGASYGPWSSPKISSFSWMMQIEVYVFKEKNWLNFLPKYHLSTNNT